MLGAAGAARPQENEGHAHLVFRYNPGHDTVVPAYETLFVHGTYSSAFAVWLSNVSLPTLF